MMENLIRPSMYLDPKNWAKSFIKFIEMVGKADDQEPHHSVLTFASDDRVEFIFSREAKIQIFTLMNIIDDKGYRNAVCLRNRQLTAIVNKRSKETLFKLRDKLIELNSDFFPNGNEPLDDIKYKGWTTYSLETFDQNRLIYVPKIEVNKIYISSIFGHYKDKPKLASDKLVFNMISNEEDRLFEELDQCLELFKRRYLK